MRKALGDLRGFGAPDRSSNHLRARTLILVAIQRQRSERLPVHAGIAAFFRAVHASSLPRSFSDDTLAQATTKPPFSAPDQCQYVIHRTSCEFTLRYLSFCLAAVRGR